MADDVFINKAATIERAVRRAREEYNVDPSTFTGNLSRQDAAILNIQRACEAALDMGHLLIRRRRLGVPQSSRDVFALLVSAGILAPALGTALQKMVAYRNIAVHDYQTLQLAITVEVIVRHLDNLLEFSRVVLQLPDPA